MKKDYIINHGEQTITITKAFAARAADIFDVLLHLVQRQTLVGGLVSSDNGGSVEWEFLKIAACRWILQTF